MDDPGTRLRVQGYVLRLKQRRELKPPAGPRSVPAGSRPQALALSRLNFTRAEDSDPQQLPQEQPRPQPRPQLRPKFPLKPRRRPLRTHCPLRREGVQALEHSQGLLAAVRRLRRSRRLCQQCAGTGRCQELEQFNLLVQQALQEVLDEWDSDGI